MNDTTRPAQSPEDAAQALAAARAASHAQYGLGPTAEDCSPHSRRPWQCRSCGGMIPRPGTPSSTR